jgi:hypothetical protein
MSKNATSFVVNLHLDKKKLLELMQPRQYSVIELGNHNASLRWAGGEPSIDADKDSPDGTGTAVDIDGMLPPGCWIKEEDRSSSNVSKEKADEDMVKDDKRMAVEMR